MNITIPRDFLQEGHEVQLKIRLHRIESVKQSNSQNSDHEESSNIQEIRVTLDDGPATLPTLIGDVSISLTPLASKVPQLLDDIKTFFFAAIMLFMSKFYNTAESDSNEDIADIAKISNDLATYQNLFIEPVNDAHDVEHQIQENEETSVINNTTQHHDASDCYDADHSGMNSTRHEQSIEMTVSSELETSVSPLCNGQESLNDDQTNATELESLSRTEVEVAADGENMLSIRSDLEDRLTLLNIRRSSLIRILSAVEEKGESQEKEFVTNLRNRQQEREQTVKEFVKSNSNFLRCSHNQKSEFKCLAFCVDHHCLSQHMVLHTKVKSDSDTKCAFCGAVYTTAVKFKRHLKNHHGNFTTDEHEKYQQIKS